MPIVIAATTRANTTRFGKPSAPVPVRRRLQRGDTVKAADRDNFGKIIAVFPNGTALVYFVNNSLGTSAEVRLPVRLLSHAR